MLKASHYILFFPRAQQQVSVEQAGMNNYPKKKQTCLQPPENFFVAFLSKRFAKTEAELDRPHVLQGVSPV